MYKIHHPKADIDRLYVIRKGGGRGLLQIAATYEAEIINIAGYLNVSINIVKSHEIIKPNMNSTIIVATNVVGELNQSNENSDTNGRHSAHKKQN